jgi:hypothetical protein
MEKIKQIKIPHIHIKKQIRQHIITIIHLLIFQSKISLIHMKKVVLQVLRNHHTISQNQQKVLSKQVLKRKKLMKFQTNSFNSKIINLQKLSQQFKKLFKKRYKVLLIRQNPL